MTLPKVSIVTITYNHENYILDALKSFLDQKYEGLIEVIIANDNSPDNTDVVINNFLSQTTVPNNFEIKYTNHTINKGMMGNFLWALQQASGKYIALCEGDDYWTDPLKLQKQVDFLEKNTDFGLVFTNCEQHFYRNGELVKKRIGIHQNIIDREFSRIEIFETWLIPTASTVFKNKFDKEKLNTYLRNPKIIYGDTLTFIVASENTKIYGMSEVMSVYRKHENGVSNYITDEQIIINHINQMIKFFGSNFNSKKIKSLKAIYYFKKFNRIKKEKPLIAFYCLFSSLFLDKNQIKKYFQNK